MDVRLILDPPASGSRNMAVDEVLLRTAASGQVTLRFYGWEPATLSLGYFQSHAARRDHAASHNLPWVRRPSGGGAIVHESELTYSFAAPLVDRFAPPEQWVRWFHESLRDALTDWNISAVLCPTPGRSHAPPFLCFHRLGTHDLLVDGQKIGGSAQRRQRCAGLIHGSILLRSAVAAPEVPGIRELTGHELSPDDLWRRWTERLVQRGAWRLRRAGLAPHELHAADLGERNRYARQDWNQRR
jgi:lipoate-protein ligase A